MTSDSTTSDDDESTTDESTANADTTIGEELAALRQEIVALREENDQLRQRIADLEERCEDREGRCSDAEDQSTDREDECDDLRDELEAEREARREAEAKLDALEAKAQVTRSMLAELQSRELEKGAHLRYDNVEPNVSDELLNVDGDRLERITKEDGQQYARLPGEEDALNRGGTVTQSTADLLPLQRLARYDDELLASVTNRKPDELAAKAWRERDDARRYGLWSKGSKDVRVYLTSSDLTDWILSREQGVNKNYAQELARRTMDAMLELSNHRLVSIKKTRRADGLTYEERRLVLKTEADIPGEVGPSDDVPATDDGARA
jgi:hypothetical protein